MDTHQTTSTFKHALYLIAKHFKLQKSLIFAAFFDIIPLMRRSLMASKKSFPLKFSKAILTVALLTNAKDSVILPTGNITESF